MTFQSVDFKSLFSHSLISDEEMMQHELLRLATFERWPDWAEHRPICLASNGFYYTDHVDKVKCFSCGGQLEKLSLIDDITKEHERNFPHCQFVRAMSASKKRFNNCHRSDADNLDVVAKYLKEIKSLSRPTETGGSKKPNEVKSLSRPTETGGSQKPNEVKSLSRPTETGGSQKPNEVKSLSRPTETGGSQKPNEVKSLSRPTETGGSQKPNEVKSLSRPTETGGSQKPNEVKSLSLPTETGGSQKPNEVKSLSRPTETGGSKKPNEVKSLSRPTETGGSQKPNEVKSLSRPTETGGSQKPNEVKSLSRPTETGGSQKPNEVKSLSRPTETGGSQKPNEVKSLSRPTETGGSQKPNEVKSLSRPTETGGSQKPNTPSVKLEVMKDEKQRLLTFRGRWPSGSPVSAEDLAKAGFYYSGSGDVVKCAFCAGILAKWMPGDNPLEEHKKFFPSCPFLASAIMCKVSAEVEFKQPVHLNNPQPSEYSVKFPKYRTESSRKESFKNWQKPSVIKPQVLAEAGFYYLGFSDNVKCFCCGGGMRDWNSGDDPWEQHAKWYSNCEYLKQCKGDHFIQQVLSSCAQATNFVGTSSVGAGSGTNNPLKLHDKDFTPCKAVAENLPSLERLTEAFYNDRIMQKIAQGCAASSERNSSGLSRRQKKNQRKKQRRNEEHEETSSCSKNEQLQDSNRGEHSGINPMELTSSDLKDDYNSEQRICKICMDKELSTAFSPCGHVMCCSDCATGLRICPICRTVITNKFRIYLP